MVGVYELEKEEEDSEDGDGDGKADGDANSGDEGRDFLESFCSKRIRSAQT